MAKEAGRRLRRRADEPRPRIATPGAWRAQPERRLGDVKRGRLLAFGSLKGGVGKTTLSMLATQALVRADRKVVLIDADVVGTEAAQVLFAGGTVDEPMLAKACVSLVDVFDRVPDSESVIRWIEKQIDADLRRMPDARRFVVPSFGNETVPEQRAWRDVLEKSGLYVQRRLRDLVSAWRARGFDVVVDLPAFDVGFAKEARDALEQEPECRVFFVTDADVRSIDATLTHLKELADAKKPEPILIINRVPRGLRVTHDDLLPNVVIELERDDEGIERHTRHWLYDGDAGAGLLDVLDGILASEQLETDVRFLRGES